METIVFLILVAFALLGAPLFAIFGGAAMFLFDSLENTPITGAANDVFSEKFADSPLLVTIPLFTFAGYLMAESGTPRRLVKLSRAWLGWMPGGLAIVCLVASAFFTTFTGGSGITIVAIGGLLFPSLVADEYDEDFSLGLVTTGGSLGLLFPPSLPIVLYGVVGGVMIEKLFLAGIIPGIITVGMLAIYSMFVGKKLKKERTPFEAGAAFKALREAIWEVILPIALLGGMYLGLLRIHEAAAFTALYVLIIEVFVYRDVSLTGDLPRVIRESMTLVGAILAILATAIGFTSYLIQASVPMLILEWMSDYITSPLMFLLVLNVFLIIVGMLMDIFSAIVVVVPLIIPIANSFGIDPYHLGIVFLLNLEIGYMTPPVGLNLFISSFRFNGIKVEQGDEEWRVSAPVTRLYKAVLPFIGLLLIALVLTTYVPSLSTYMTTLMDDPADMDTGGQLELDPIDDEGDSGGSTLSLDDLEDEFGDDDDDGPLNLDDLEGELDDEDDLDSLDDEDDEDDGPLSLDDLEDELGLDDEPLEDEPLEDEPIDESAMTEAAVDGPPSLDDLEEELGDEE